MLPITSALRPFLRRMTVHRPVAPFTRFSSFSTTKSGFDGNAALPPSDLSYRALLRNLRLLAGMRTELDGDNSGASSSSLRAIVTGYDAESIATRLAFLEGGVKFEVVGDSLGIDVATLEKLRGQKYDSIIISQAYHTLQSRAVFASIHAALDPEAGTLGLLWTRAVATGDPWVETFGKAVAKTSSSSSTSTLPLLKHGQSPMQWVDEALDVPAFRFRPFKHRKFVERIAGKHADLLPLLRVVHDARLPLPMMTDINGPSTGFDAGVKAVLDLPAAKAKEDAALILDLHAFNTSVIPPEKPTKKK